MKHLSDRLEELDFIMWKEDDEVELDLVGILEVVSGWIDDVGDLTAAQIQNSIY